MQSYQGRFEPTRFSDLFRGVPLERFRELVDDNLRTRRYRRVTFTGGEVTLERKKLFDYVRYAAERGGFEHIRLQTNGRLLADERYARALLDTGIDELFVSLHGPDAACQDAISQRPGSFDEAWQGLLHLRALGACVITNTVLTTMNVDRLTELVDRVAEIAPARMEFWNYLPMEDYADARDLLAPMSELAPALRAALSRARSLAIPCAVKYVPRCLLGEHGDTIDNGQPDVVIVEDFYDTYPKFSCLYEAICEHSEACLGLHHPYIAKFGWEDATLAPTARVRPWREPEDGLALGSDGPGAPTASAAATPFAHPEWRALVDGVAEARGAALSAVLLDRRRCTYRFTLPSGANLDLVLTHRSDDRPALARTRSFDVAYRPLSSVDDAERTALVALAQAAARAIAERDAGTALLDDRKGLIAPDALRRKR
jgi:MoaA/NifB/PqqE/SkfB family radical SAM enzyme